MLGAGSSELLLTMEGARGSRERGLRGADRLVLSFEIWICTKVKVSGLVKYSSKYADELGY